MMKIESMVRNGKAKISFGEVIVEVIGENLRKIHVRVASPRKSLGITADAESLLYWLDVLRIAVETVISELSPE